MNNYSQKSLTTPDVIKKWAEMNGFYYIDDQRLITNRDDPPLEWFTTTSNDRKSYLKAYLAGYGSVADCLLTNAYIHKNEDSELWVRWLIDYSTEKYRNSKALVGRIMTLHRGSEPVHVEKVWCIERGWVELIYNNEGDWTEEIRLENGTVEMTYNRWEGLKYYKHVTGYIPTPDPNVGLYIGVDERRKKNENIKYRMRFGWNRISITYQSQK